jgi:hypothetical protein
MMVRGSIERDQPASPFVMTEQRRAVLAALPHPFHILIQIYPGEDGFGSGARFFLLIHDGK